MKKKLNLQLIHVHGPVDSVEPVCHVCCCAKTLMDQWLHSGMYVAYKRGYPPTLHLCQTRQGSFAAPMTSASVPSSARQNPPPLKGVTTAVSPSVLALRSEQGRDSFPRVATQPEKGRTTSSSARTKPGEGGQQGALRTSTQHGTPPSTQQQLAPMLRWSGEWRNEVGGQRR